MAIVNNNAHSTNRINPGFPVSTSRMLFIIVLVAAIEASYYCLSLFRNPGSDSSSTATSLRSYKNSKPRDKKKPVMPIEELSIIGERNSGTRWTVRHLTECFNHSLLVRERLVRHKHWFQHDVPNGRDRVGTAVVAVFRKSYSLLFRTIRLSYLTFERFSIYFFSCCVSYRIPTGDPYYWLEAMRKVPHHAPLHYKLEWEQFVKTPWTMPRLPSDLEERKTQKNAKDVECQEYFHYDQIISCREKPYPEGYFNKTVPMSGDKPQYELRNDGSGRPYASILELRSDKIKNHLSVSEWDWIQDFFQVRYEDLLKKGTEYMIQHVSEITGVEPKCNPSPPQNRETRPLTNSYIRWMTKYVDWEAEALVGYKPWNGTEAPY